MPRDDGRFRQPGSGFGLSVGSGLLRDIVGIIAPDGATYSERIKHRPLTVGGQVSQNEHGVGRKLTGSNGIYTPTYRAWADWELTTGAHSFVALIELSAYASASGFVGNSNGSNGYFVGQRYADGTPYAMIGGTAAFISGSAGQLRLNRPHVMGVTYSGTGAGVAKLYLDGKYINQATGLTSGSSWGNYCAPFLGAMSGVFGTLTGTAYWGALWARELTAEDMLELAARPWQFWVPDQGWEPEIITAGAPTFQPAWAVNSNAIIQAGVLHA